MDLKELAAGWQRFKRDDYPSNRNLLAAIATGEPSSPLAAITCVDPRLNLSWITSQRGGQITPFHSLGTIVPPYGNHSLSQESYLEFVINGFKSEHLAVIGHSDCKMVKALLGPKDKLVNIGPGFSTFASLAHDTATAVFRKFGHQSGATNLRAAIEVHTLLQVQHLHTYPVVQHALASGKLQIHPMFYDIACADLYEYGEQSGRFELLGQGDRKMIQVGGTHTCGGACHHDV